MYKVSLRHPEDQLGIHQCLLTSQEWVCDVHRKGCKEEYQIPGVADFAIQSCYPVSVRECHVVVQKVQLTCNPFY